MNASASPAARQSGGPLGVVVVGVLVVAVVVDGGATVAVSVCVAAPLVSAVRFEPPQPATARLSTAIAVSRRGPVGDIATRS
jgi:hypothetical protein